MLILATASFGLAHRSSQEDFDPELAAYLQAGGTITDLCGDLEGGPHRTAQDCEACRLVDGALAARGTSEFRPKITAQTEAARAAIPGGTLKQYVSPRTNDVAALFRVDKEDGAIMVAIDPYTAQVLETFPRRNGSYDFADSIHSSLMLGVTGIWFSVFLVSFLISGSAWAGFWGGKIVQAWSQFPAEN